MSSAGSSGQVYLRNEGFKVALGSKHSSSSLLFSHFALLPTLCMSFSLEAQCVWPGGAEEQALEEEIPSAAPTGSVEDSQL